MPVSVPIAGLLASLGLYGVVIAAIALRNPEKLDEHHANLQEPIEWVAVLCISLFGMIGTAVTLGVSGGYAVPYLISTAIVGVLGFGFFKALEITPTPIFAFLVNTRFFGTRGSRRRRGMLHGLKRMWVESSIDGDMLDFQRETDRRVKSQNAFGGALAMATVITGANTYWAVRLIDALDLSFIALAPLGILWVALVYVLGRAGGSLAARAKTIDWRRPF